jgi:hypothetical protein
MASTPLAWGPREGKILCVIDLDFAPDIEHDAYPLDVVLRMCIDFCKCSVWKKRIGLDTQPPPPKSLADFGTLRELKEYLDHQREDAEKNPWIPSVEVIPPTTLFTDPTNPGIRINLVLPEELTAEVRSQFAQKWQELMADVRQGGVGPFLDLYQKSVGCLLCGGPPVNHEHPLNRWEPLHLGSGLICVKNPQRRDHFPA